MSRRTNEAALSPLPRSHTPFHTWVWLGVAAAMVVALVIGFLRAGRPFWHSSGILNEHRALYALQLQALPRAID